MGMYPWVPLITTSQPGIFLRPQCEVVISGTVQWHRSSGTVLGGDRLAVAIDRICRQNEDLWEGAKTFANEIHNVDINTAKRLAPARLFKEKPEQSDEK